MKEGQEDVKLDDAGDDTVVTKELYLCGNCSEGFGSVQECKLHMLEQHDVAEFQSASTANTGMPKVDAGTQVELKKKGGRKKKSEQVQTNITSIHSSMAGFAGSCMQLHIVLIVVCHDKMM